VICHNSGVIIIGVIVSGEILFIDLENEMAENIEDIE
jgi:hypothetical protein